MFIAYIILHSSTIQTYLTQQIASYLSKKLKTEVSVGGVDISLFKSIILEKVYVQDQRKDTLLYLDRLKINIRDISFSQHNILINNVRLENPVVNLYLDSLRKMNYSFILAALKGEKDTTASAPWNIYLHSVEIENGSFTYKRWDSQPKLVGMNYSDIGVSRINLDVKGIKLFPDSMFCEIENLEGHEKSGIWLRYLSSDVALDTNGIFFTNAMINTASSRISAKKLAFQMKSIDDLDDFEHLVKINAELNPSLIGAVDISYFATDLWGLKEKIVLSGNIKGTVSDFKAKNIKLRYLDNTYLAGKITITGLPDIKQTFMMMEFSELSTNAYDLSQIPIPPFDKNNKIEIPDQLKQMGKLNYKGQLTGFLSDFVAYGNLKTDMGIIKTDISIKQDTVSGFTGFKGHLITQKFDLGSVFKIKETLGAISLNAKIDGKTKGSKLNANIEGIIEDIVVQNYTYRNIKIEGDVSEKTFNGSFNIDDPNVRLGFLGRIDYSDKLPVFDFTADVSNARLKNLNLYKTDSLANLSFLLSARFSGDNLDNISGKMELFSLKYKSSHTNVDFGLTSLISEKTEQGNNIRFSSDALDATLSGQIRFDNLLSVFDKIIRNYAPSVHIVAEDPKKTKPFICDDNWNLEARFKNTKPVTDEFIPDLIIENGTEMNVKVNCLSDNLELKVFNGNIAYKGILIEKPELNVNTEKGKLLYSCKSKNVRLDSTINMRNVILRGFTQNNAGDIEISWENPDSVLYSGNLSASYRLKKIEGKPIPALFLEFNPSRLVLSDTDWYLNDAKAEIYDSLISISEMTINHDLQYLYINGKVSKNPSDTLTVLLNQIDIAMSNLFVKNSGLELGGLMSGEARLSGLFGKATLFANIKIDSLLINKEELGNAVISSEWENFSENINIVGYTKRGNLKTIDFKGKFFTSGAIDFEVTLDKLKLNIVEPYVKDVLCDVRGIVGGKLNIKGNLSNPQIEGLLKVQKASFMVSYLQVRYNFTTNIIVNQKSFDLKNVDVYDVDGNKAVINGTISHDNFRDFKFQSTITTDNFLFLNTAEKDNELYYGKAYLSGVVGFSGNPEKMYIEVNAKTEKNTKFYLPLSSSSEISEQNFIRFINDKEDTLRIEDKRKVDLSGVQLSLNLQVTPDAEAQIIFDSKVGDVIKGKGSGNLKLEITPTGDFNMFGDYTIESGDYLFTLQNVINKKFEVEKGGTISWNGNPYLAILDITASYKLKASLYDLMLDSAYKQRVPVECVLNMRNNLMKPDFQFSIKLPEGDSRPNSVINSLSNEEINKQIISLLVLNRFVTPESFKGGAQSAEARSGNAVGINSSELLSNQLSHWLSQISKDFDIGINYRPGDEISHDEVELALGTQILNDRVILNGNVGVGGSQTTRSNSFVGDFEVDVKINKSGKLMVKGFNRSNTDMINDTAPYTQGFGLFYREDFDNINELLRRYWHGVFRRKEDDVKQ